MIATLATCAWLAVAWVGLHWTANNALGAGQAVKGAAASIAWPALLAFAVLAAAHDFLKARIT